MRGNNNYDGDGIPDAVKLIVSCTECDGIWGAVSNREIDYVRLNKTRIGKFVLSHQKSGINSRV